MMDAQDDLQGHCACPGNMMINDYTRRYAGAPAGVPSRQRALGGHAATLEMKYILKTGLFLRCRAVAQLRDLGAVAHSGTGEQSDTVRRLMAIHSGFALQNQRSVRAVACRMWMSELKETCCVRKRGAIANHRRSRVTSVCPLGPPRHRVSSPAAVDDADGPDRLWGVCPR
jgi:hypothetical protein